MTLSSAVLIALTWAAPPAAEAPTAGARWSCEEAPERLTLACDSQVVAEFGFRDPKILRPYFANLRTLSGRLVSRRHPPQAGAEAVDHDTMHPGLWLAFGDVSGSDFWRNKGRIEHERFLQPPQAAGDSLMFATQSRLLTPKSEPIGSLTSRFVLTARPNGWLLVWEAKLNAGERPLALGDQEEMGFGGRVATAISEKRGGRIVNDRGQTTAAATWGQPAAWCDYSGAGDGRPVGLTLFAGPQNFRPSWWHNRDYGLLVANSFGRAALKQGAPSVVTVAPGETLRLCFGAAVHEGEKYDPAVEYRAFEAIVR